MIKRKDLLAFNFYKKEKFTGSYHGMRYLIQKAEEGEETFFSVYTWSGPFNFATTEDEKKTEKRFPFQEDSLEAITNYLNEVYEADKGNWPNGIEF
ncbi:GNAT family acetyltransferase [Roseburia sp. BX1005]|uniref:GNAT family acetyltransferase n=1 Tax=Roseburia zhanii TaxID=2763064 RepID=A0A923LQZ7_9FIRM|nr:GNAT family acetyltransferase [Roseburia zhanii]MBC5714671.1 GNAT family acetyltransferase [Roseburia zhanii]